MPFLQNLHEFNPALAYGFDPESAVEDVSGVQYVIHTASQYDDVYNAYFYAQETVLTEIKKEGINNLTPEKLLTWLNEIHLRISATLAADNKVEAGKYLGEGQDIIRWHTSVKIEKPIMFYLSFPDMPDEDADKAIALTMKDFDVNHEEIKAFLNLAKRYRGEVKLLANNAPDINVGRRALAGLIDAYIHNKLTTEENNIVKKIVTKGMSPSEIPEAMNNFAKKTVENWKKCNPNSIDEVAEFLSTTFYELSGEIHPYFNGNGRTATCLINIILRSLNLPSILLRNPSERDDPDSAYSKAIKGLMKGNPALLSAHIKSRIVDAKDGKQYSDNDLKEIFLLRVELKNILINIQKDFPGFDLKNFFTKHEDIAEKRGKDNDSVKKYLRETVDACQKEHTKLTIKKAMKILTGHDGWKVDAKNGFTPWIQLPEEEIKALQLPAFTLGKRKLNYGTIVMIENIDIPTLLAEAKKKENETVNDSAVSKTLKVSQ